MGQIKPANSQRPSTLWIGTWVALSLAISAAAAVVADRVSGISLGIGLAVVLIAAGILLIWRRQVAPNTNSVTNLRRELNRSRRGYERLFTSVPCFICVLNRDHQIVEANELYREAFGTTDRSLCYEVCKGRTSKCPDCLVDQAFEDGIDRVEESIEQPGLRLKDRLPAMVEALTDVRDRFRAVPARYTGDKPLIAVVGEIYCRLNTFSNYDAVRKVEAHGGEVWLSEVTEWIWYTNWSQKQTLRRMGKTFSTSMLGALLKNQIQRRDEDKLYEPFQEDFVGYEEPHDVYRQVLKPAWPYLPADGALGEMVLSVGKAIYSYRKGADGVVDISPFSCMNGIVSEAVYHAVAHDHDDLPIRTFYFDATSSNMERDLDIFMELTRSYRKRKRVQRRYPAYFQPDPATAKTGPGPQPAVER